MAVATTPLAASEVRVAAEVFRTGADPTAMAVALERDPGPRGELRALTIDWRVDGGELPGDGAVFATTSGRLRMARGQRTATVALRLRPEVVDGPRRFARFSVTRVRGGALGQPSAADLEVGGTAVDEEVWLGAGERPQVAFLADGGSLVAWESDHTVRVGRFDAAGRLVRPGISPVRQRDPSCCELAPRAHPDPDGGFLLTWLDGDGDRRGIWAQRFDALDRAVSAVFRLASETALEQLDPRIDFLPDGGFLASFRETDNVAAMPFLGNALMVRRFAADHTDLGPQRQLAPTGGVNTVVATAPLADGGSLVLTAHFARHFGTDYAVHTLAADGSRRSVTPLAGAQAATELVARDTAEAGVGGFAVLGCHADRWVLWVATAAGAVFPDPIPFQGGALACGTPATLLPGRPARLGQFSGDTSTLEPAISLLRARRDGTGWDLLRLAQVRCLNAGMCDWAHGVWSGAVDQGRETVALAWDASDGVWLRRFPDQLTGTVWAAPPGPRTAPAEEASLRLLYAGDVADTTVTWATRDDSARAGRDYVAAQGAVALVAGATVPTSVELAILDPAGVTADTSLRVALTPQDPQIAVATPRRAPIFIIRNTVCGRDGVPALCLLRGSFEVQARYRLTDGSERNATPIAVNDRNGLFTYGEPGAGAVPEVAIKVLGTRQEPTVYWGSVAERPTSLQIGDDISGRFGWLGDEMAGAEACGAGISSDPYGPYLGAAEGSAWRDAETASGLCAWDGTELCLLAGRYAVAGRWINPWDGSAGVVTWHELSDDVGIGTFDGQLLEALVRMEQRAGGVLFVAAPLTDFALELTVRDTLTGATRSFAPGAGARCRIWEPALF